MAWCPRCNKTYDGLASTGLCPLCGGSATAWPGASLGLGVLVLAGLLLIGGAIALVFRTGQPASDNSIPSLPAPEIAPTEFPAANATIRPPREWQYDQRAPDSIAFSHRFKGGALRFRIAPPTTGRDAHLALVRELVPGAELDSREVPPWPGAEALSLKLAGHPQRGASWILPHGDKCLQIFFWGDDAYLADVARFREGMTLR